MANIGIDFGTTNSAIAIADAGGTRLVPLAGEPYWRTILYFEHGGGLTAGSPAIARYVETSGDGRLVQSIKSHLASESFARTSIFGRRWQLDDMIAAYLRKLRAAAPIDLGARCVIGRPVRYWGAETAEDDARAVERMRSALGKAGFTDVVFEYEPVAAAARYAATLARDELIVVADFGGGTADFSALRVSPTETHVLASGGIGISGDAFDARVIDAVVAPALGRGTKYDSGLGEVVIPAWLYSHLRRWHLLSFLKAESTQRLFARIMHGARDPEKIDRFARVVDEDLGLPLHRAVEGAKVRLSSRDADRVDFDAIELAIPVTRAAFEAWIADDLDAIDGVLDDVLARAGIAAGDVDHVFATGGSSLVPAVRGRLAARFGAGKLAGGDGGADAPELTSVAWGLAVRAQQLA